MQIFKIGSVILPSYHSYQVSSKSGLNLT